MKKVLIILLALGSTYLAYSQNAKDLSESVPCWIEYAPTNNEATLKWIPDDSVVEYTISKLTFEPFGLETIETIDGTMEEYPLGVLDPGQEYHFYIRKTNTNSSAFGVGVITAGIELPVVSSRGRCLIAIEDTLLIPLEMELARLMEDIEMDGWTVDTIHIHHSMEVTAVKSRISDWYQEADTLSQTLFLLGNLPVPYSGNYAYDGHNNHEGAWAADCFYGEMDGIWTDQTVDNTTPTRQVNKNVPGDGKYDQTGIPGSIEIAVGRVDFSNLPAFSEDEIELTRKYLNKNHEFRTGQKDYPRRAIVENNFASFAEGFGQSAWRSYVPMFGGEEVTTGDYNTTLETEGYLCSYACGAGSYGSASGIGSTVNLWSAKEIKTVFTMNFGSYFGDWDSQNNFLRGALGSGDILTNAWAGRPVWHLYPMAIGQPIGFCAKLTQNITSAAFSQGFGAHSTHIALMGDPTLRLHPVLPPEDLSVDFSDGNINLNWSTSLAATSGYMIYRSINGSPWQELEAFYPQNTYEDVCVASNTTYRYMIKALHLEESASGSYYNTSQGIAKSISIAENPALLTFYQDLDMDGFGNEMIDTLACQLPVGYVGEATDCDDTNANIYPGAIEIPSNGIDEDCNGEDLIASLEEWLGMDFRLYPTPAQGELYIELAEPNDFRFQFFQINGQVLEEGAVQKIMDVSQYLNGVYGYRLIHKESGQSLLRKVVIQND